MEQITENLPVEKKPKLLDQVRNVLRTKHYALKTEEAYVHWIQGVRYLINLILNILANSVENIKLITHKKDIISPRKKFIFFHNKHHPREMGAKEINQFLTHLAVKEKVSASTQNQALCAIVFLYKTVEIIVDRQKWNLNESRMPPNKIMKLRIEYGERQLAQQVKSLGGRWDSHKKTWKLPFRYVQILKLEDRIIKNKNGG